MHAIAFRSTQGPGLVAPTNANHCALWVWRTELFPTNDSGLDLETSTRQGFIVQKVEIIRNVTRCDDTPDAASSDRGTGWEYWDLTRATPWIDQIAQPFLKERKTDIQVTLTAGYLAQIAGATLTDTPNNPSGAHGKLSGEPQGFKWTLERRINFGVECCGAAAPLIEWFLAARNSFETYNEVWEYDATTDTVNRVKEVDGQPVD